MSTNQSPQNNAPTVPVISVRIDKMLDGQGKTKAYASANIGGAFAVHGMRVIETDKGRFIAMPQDSYMMGNVKKYTDLFHAVTAEARTALIEAVNAAYEQKLAQQQGQPDMELPDMDIPEQFEAPPTQDMEMNMSM